LDVESIISDLLHAMLHAAVRAVLVLRRASTERLTGVAWHPNARPTIHLQQGADAAAASSGTVALGTGCADGSAALWSEGGKLLRKLEGHTERCGRVAFHPMGMQFVSCCSSWCLLDFLAMSNCLAAALFAHGSDGSCSSLQNKSNNLKLHAGCACAWYVLSVLTFSNAICACPAGHG
jgi:WD40 repeat protein